MERESETVSEHPHDRMCFPFHGMFHVVTMTQWSTSNCKDSRVSDPTHLTASPKHLRVSLPRCIGKTAGNHVVVFLPMLHTAAGCRDIHP